MHNKIKILALAAFLISCQINPEVLETVFAFPEHIKEVSAVETPNGSEWIWTLEDSGNPAELYAINLKGELVNTLKINDAKNVDWEELTSDDDGNLYIGDFGNNHNMRKDLCIYKIDASELKKAETTPSAKIDFYFPEQTAFPPPESGQYYDLESFFVFNDIFYLFTKNRSSEYDGTTLLYAIPNVPGNHAAKLMGSFKTCGDFRNCAVTSADISPDGNKIALLSYSHIWLFSKFKKDDFFKGKVQQIDLVNFSQKEGVCFVTNNKLYVTDERKKKNGGKLYQVDLTKLKTKS
jgi:WD40 repeat protein